MTPKTLRCMTLTLAACTNQTSMTPADLLTAQDLRSDPAPDLRPGEDLGLAPRPRSSLGLAGNPRDARAVTPPQPGVVLMGGGPDVDAAMRWLLQRAGGGDVVVLRASGGAAYNQYLYDLATVDSVETLLIDSEAHANDPAVERVVREAEAVFIAGGDQSDYLRLWRGTLLQRALTYLYQDKGVPMGGTSAGCAILGQLYFSAAQGTVRSAEALADPMSAKITLGRDFLRLPELQDLITDTHYDNPDRRGRHVAFLARIATDWGVLGRGIGVDEATAVCVDPSGKALVLGAGAGFFLRAEAQPEECQAGRPLRWDNGRKAVSVYQLSADGREDRSFDIKRWQGGPAGTWQHYYADSGTLYVAP